MKRRLSLLLLISSLVGIALLTVSSAATPARSARAITLASGVTVRLNVPDNLSLSVAAQGLKRVRFMAKSPDGRLFVTDMYDRTDNKQGSIYAFSSWKSGTLTGRTTYLSGLRNPNSLAFTTDSSGKAWLYVALTDKLVRYAFQGGDIKPSSAAQTLATFPDYGLSYKYGGWHLTRTVAIAGGKVYASVGSSCNACVEKEAVRASILKMNLDGSSQRSFACGLRNAVGLKFVGKTLYATNMGADHLGDNLPNDQLYAVQDGKNYGWPYCYVRGTRALTDQQYNPGGKLRDCSRIPVAMAGLPAHGAPLGLEYFADSSVTGAKDSFVVALHGSGFIRIGAGYGLWRVTRGGLVTPLIDGFLREGKIYGRPADVLAWGDGFLFTDDYAGVIYYAAQR